MPTLGEMEKTMKSAFPPQENWAFGHFSTRIYPRYLWHHTTLTFKDNLSPTCICSCSQIKKENVGNCFREFIHRNCFREIVSDKMVDWSGKIRAFQVKNEGETFDNFSKVVFSYVWRRQAKVSGGLLMLIICDNEICLLLQAALDFDHLWHLLQQVVIYRLSSTTLPTSSSRGRGWRAGWSSLSSSP